MKKYNILVTGSKGQLGNELKKVFNNKPAFNVTFTDVDDLDICNEAAVFEFVQKNCINLTINAAAYTAVDRAEQEKELAFKINEKGSFILAKVSQQNNCPLIHVSTDYVFDGKNHRPYIETDKTEPVSMYGKSKLAGEQVIEKTSQNYIIIRTSWLYSSFGNNFVKTMLRLSKEKEEIGVVYDQVGSPTYAYNLANAIQEITVQYFKDKSSFVPGIYHYSDEGVCSWYDLAYEIMQIENANTTIKAIESKNFPTPATRPFYSVLGKEKIKNTFNISVPNWKESLKICLQELNNK